MPAKRTSKTRYHALLPACGGFLLGAAVATAITHFFRTPPTDTPPPAVSPASATPTHFSSPTSSVSRSSSSAHSKSSTPSKKSAETPGFTVQSEDAVAEQSANSMAQWTVIQAAQSQEKIDHWLPLLADRLHLTPQQTEALRALLAQKGPAILEEIDQQLALAPAQQALWQQWQNERRLSRAEDEAQSTLSQLQSNLPLNAAQKDQVWQLLSSHALQNNDPNATLEQQEILQNQLREKLTQTLGPQASSFIEKALPRHPPETLPDLEDPAQ